MALYNDIVMEHFMNPQNVGELENPDGSGTYGSPVCGDMMQIQIKVEDETIVSYENGKLTALKAGVSYVNIVASYNSYTGDDYYSLKRTIEVIFMTLTNN